MRIPFNTLHKPIVLSKDPDARYSPSGENTTLFTEEECPMSLIIFSPLDILHKPIVLSQDPEAKYNPFGENSKLFTESKWPVKDLIISPL